MIEKLQQQWGNKWARIAERLPGRTDNAVKNRWNSTLKRRVQSQQMLQLPPPPLMHLEVPDLIAPFLQSLSFSGTEEVPEPPPPFSSPTSFEIPLIEPFNPDFEWREHQMGLFDLTAKPDGMGQSFTAHDPLHLGFD
jgi:hypothetical protein